MLRQNTGQGCEEARDAAEIAKRRAEYARLLHEHEPTLLRAARRMCGLREDAAQDLVQEALIRGYQAYLAGRFEVGTNARAWLFRILTNLFLTEYRHNQRWNAGIDLDTLTSQGDTGPEALQADAQEGPEASLLTQTLDEPLERALAALSEELRVCVILVDIEEMEYAAAAAMLDIPVGTVRSRLFRARAKLYTLLYDYARNHRRV